MEVVRLRVFLTLIALLSGAGAYAQGPDVKDLDQRCAKAEDVAELKACVTEYREKYQKLELEYEGFIDIVTGCFDRKTAREVRSCVSEGASVSASASAPKDQQSPKPETVPSTPPPKPEWRVSEEASRMDGSPTVYMSLMSDEPVLNEYGTPMRVSLHIRCRERVTNLFVAGDWFLGTARPISMMLRLDQDKPMQQSWEPSSNGKAAGLWAGSTAVPFIKSLLGKETLLVRLAPYNEAPKEMAFTVSGLAKVIEPLRKACGW